MATESSPVSELVQVGDVLAFNNIIKLASRTEEFLDWVRTERGIEDVDGCFEGYNYFLRVAINGLIFSITNNPSLGIQEDAKFYRARFQGLSIEEIPNTCEQTRLIKHIWLVTKTLRKARDWDKLKKGIVEIETITDPIDRIFRYYCVGNIDNRLNLLRDHTVFTLHNYFNDTGKGRPLGSFVSYFIELPKKEVYLARAYQGYVLTLEYVWRSLIGPEAFLNTSFKDLHHAYELFGETIVDDSIDLFGADLKALEPDDDLDPRIEAEIIELSLNPRKYHQSADKLKEEDRKKLVSWLALDNFYSKSWDELRQRGLGTIRGGPFDDDGLKARRTCTKIFRSMVPSDLPEPEYLLKTDPQSLHKQLDCHFLWGSVSVLDSHKGMVFSGVPAFVTLLLGSVDLRRRSGDEEPVLARTFKHPVDVEKGHSDYSYAIYVEAYGTISDYSGWLVFLDCAGDYSGFAGSLYQMANRHINSLKELGTLDHNEVTISRKAFERYLKMHHVGFEGGTSERVIDQQKRVLADAQGKLFERLVYESLLVGRYLNCSVDVSIDSEQIDCIGQAETWIDVYECKVDVHMDFNEVIRQLLRKRDTVQRLRPEFKVVPHLVVYRGVAAKRRSVIENNGIWLHDNFRKEIETMRIFDAGRDQLIRVLEYGVGYPADGV